MEGHRYIGQGCPIPKVGGANYECPPLYTDVGVYCVPNNDILTSEVDTLTTELPSNCKWNRYTLFIYNNVTGLYPGNKYNITISNFYN